MNMTNLKRGTAYIMQGISGSGKSTLAHALTNAHGICSADDSFMENGVYKFDPKKLPLAHAACLRKFTSLVTTSAGVIVVDNTNTTIAEIAPYYALAEAHDFNAVIVTVDCPPHVAAARNTHGVPLAACVGMSERIAKTNKELPPWWNRLDSAELLKRSSKLLKALSHG